jgi:hypothetical protein
MLRDGFPPIILSFYVLPSGFGLSTSTHLLRYGCPPIILSICFATGFRPLAVFAAVTPNAFSSPLLLLPNSRIAVFAAVTPNGFGAGQYFSPPTTPPSSSTSGLCLPELSDQLAHHVTLYVTPTLRLCQKSGKRLPLLLLAPVRSAKPTRGQPLRDPSLLPTR